MSNSIAGLFNQFFDSKMEGFETAFPAKVKKVNLDGTVDIVPCIKNVLKNMQLEPTLQDGTINQVYGVPLLHMGNSSVIVELEIKAGDPVLCVSSSRDLKAWINGGWKSDKPYNPQSFSGNDLNDLMAIPMRRLEHEKDATHVFIDHSGAVSVKTEKKVVVKSKYFGIKGDLVVDGDIQATGDVAGGLNSMPISLTSHVHVTPAGPSEAPKQLAPIIPIIEPE